MYVAVAIAMVGPKLGLDNRIQQKRFEQMVSVWKNLLGAAMFGFDQGNFGNVQVCEIFA